MAQTAIYEEVPKEPLNDLKKEDSSISEVSHEQLEYKVYARRWLILFIYLCFAFVNNIQWIQYAIINNLVQLYYNVSSIAVEWTSISFMAMFIPFIFPASYLLEKKGLKWAILLGTLGTTVGPWIKVASVAPDRFWVTFIGQLFVGMSQVFLLGIPPRLAAVWFGSNQVSTACSIGVFGNQLGVAAGFLLPPLFVKNHENVEDIGSDLSLMFNCTAGVCTVVLILVIFFFRAAPLLPPSPQEALKLQRGEEGGFFSGMKRLMLNKGFILLLITYSMDVAVLNSMSTMLNEIILEHFPGGEEFGGRVGLVNVVGGMIGSVIFGIILDRTRKYKETTVAVYGFGTFGMLAFTFALGTGSHILVYLTAALLGCFVGGYMPVGFELGSELTYPEPEGTTAGLIILATQIVSVIHAILYSWMVKAMGDFWANIVLTITLFLGTGLTAMIPSDLRRQAAHKASLSQP